MTLDASLIVRYNVQHMVQLVGISKARSNLAGLIQKVKSTRTPVVILQDSSPSVVLYPYDEIIKRDEEKEELFTMRFQEIYKEGKKSFKRYLKKNNLQPPRTEEEAYKIIKNA